MRRISTIVLVLLILLSVQPMVSADTPTVSVIMEEPSTSPTVPAGEKVTGIVKFFVSGEGKTSISGRFMVDGVPGPSYYRTITAPIDSQYLVFETDLPTYYTGEHEVYFEVLYPNVTKTCTARYTVTAPEVKRISIKSPKDGMSVESGEMLTANAEVKLTGFGSKVVDGYWLIDGERHEFSETAFVAGDAYIKLSQSLPTNIPGSHTYKLVLKSPYTEESKELSYIVEGTEGTVVKIDPIIEGTTIHLDSPLSIVLRITVAKDGVTPLLGHLFVDGELYHTLNETITQSGVYSYTLTVPTSGLGEHSVYFRLTSPVTAASNIITYRVVGTSWVWPRLIYPADGTTVKQGDPLIAQLGLHVGGVGTVKIVGQWLIDDNPYSDVEQLLSASSSTVIYESLNLPTDSPGWHRLKFRQTWPQWEETREIWYRVWGREQPPSFIDITAIPQPPYPQQETFQLHIKANDDRGISQVKVQLDSQLMYTADMGGLQVIDYVTPAIGPLTAGDHWWRVLLTDLDGLETDYIGRFTVTSGDGSLIGSVIEKGSNMPIEGAVVSCAGHTALTDEYGKYTITELGVGEQVVSATHSGFGSAEARVTIFSGMTTTAPVLELSEAGPQPAVYLIETYPPNPIPGQPFLISVYVRNDGDQAGLSEVVVSSPDNANLEIDPDTGAQYPSFSHVYNIGSFLEHRDGQQIRAIHQCVVVNWNVWGRGTTRKVLLKATAPSEGKYQFWVRATMNIDDRQNRVNSPRTSTILDQTGWSCKIVEIETKQ